MTNATLHLHYDVSHKKIERLKCLETYGFIMKNQKWVAGSFVVCFACLFAEQNQTDAASTRLILALFWHIMTCLPGTCSCMMTSWHGNVFHITGSLWGESIGQSLWFPLTKSQWCEALIFPLMSASNQTPTQTVQRLVNWDALILILCHYNTFISVESNVIPLWPTAAMWHHITWWSTIQVTAWFNWGRTWIVAYFIFTRPSLA